MHGYMKFVYLVDYTEKKFINYLQGNIANKYINLRKVYYYSKLYTTPHLICYHIIIIYEDLSF